MTFIDSLDLVLARLWSISRLVANIANFIDPIKVEAALIFLLTFLGSCYVITGR